MKKTLSLLLAALMLIGVFAPTIPIAAVAQTAADPFEGYSEWDGVTFDTSPFEGITADNGGADVTGDPVIIDTAAKLAGLAKIVNEKAVMGSYGAYKNLPIYITKNINLNGHEFPSIGKDYIIAMFSGRLEGRLDGVEGKAVTIANAYVPGQAANNTGFIGNLRGGAVKNLTLVNAVVGNKNNAGGVGIMIGYASKEVELSGLTVIDSTLIVSKNGGTVSHGGVIGCIKSNNSLNLKDIKAINVTLECPGTMQSIAGGVIGWLQGQSSRPDVVYALENCYFSGTFANATQNLDADGLIADVYLGGIVGDIQTAAKVSMKNCQFNGEILSNLASTDRICQFGSFVASIGAGGQLTLENCLDTGVVSAGQSGKSAIIGYIGVSALTLSIINSYSASNCVTIGASDSTTTHTAAFTSVAVANLLGNKAKNTLTDFDFDNIWKANEGALPCLKSVNDTTWITAIPCNHSYTNYGDHTLFNHTLICAYCNETKTESHTLQYVSTSNVQHRKFCACGYSVYESHSNDYYNANTLQHIGDCRHCDYRGFTDHNWVAVNVIHGTTKPVGGQGTEPETDENGYVNDKIPDSVDFGGAQVKALIWRENRQYLFPEEEQTHEKTIKTDIFLRNKEIEADLGIKFDPTFKESNMSGSSNQAELFNTALEGSEDWDIICCYSLYPTMMMTEGILYDLNSMQFPMTEMPWYSKDIKNWEIRDRLFYIANNSSIRNIIACWCVYVNNTMLQSKGVADIEETVINMEWTFGKMKEISRNWASEAETNTDNHADAENVYGLGITHRTAMQAFYHAAGFRPYELDEATGKQKQVYFESANIKLVSDFCDVIVDLCNSPEVKVGPYSSGSAGAVPQFGLKNHNAALFVSALDQTGYIKDRTDYSVIPLPMKNDEQGRYYTIQNYAYDVWCVPTTTWEPEMGGTIIEAISSDDYRNIAPKWWDDDFKYRYASGDNGVKIFDLIRSGIVADFGRVTGAGSPYNALSSVLMPSATDDTIKNEYAVQVGSGKASAQLALKNLYAIVDALLFNVKYATRQKQNVMHTSQTADQDTALNILQTYVCSECGATKTEASATHAWESIDETPATHLADGHLDCICSCGYHGTLALPKLAEHEYFDFRQFSATQHAKYCACGDMQLEAHRWNNGAIVVAPSAATEGTKIFACEDCGAVKYETIPPTGENPDCNHAYGPWVPHDATQHKKSCACGDVVLENHHWDEGRVTTPATHIAKGVKTYTCTECDATRTEEIAKLSEHAWDDGVITQYPTHTAFGTKTFTCPCGQTKTEQLAKNTAHSYGTWQSCDDLKHQQSCACGDVKYATHQWDAGSVTQTPTVDSEGEKTYVCVDCGETKTEALDKLPESSTPDDENPNDTDPETPGEDETDKVEPDKDESDHDNPNGGNILSGCKSSLAGSTMLLALISLAGVCLISKKKTI